MTAEHVLLLSFLGLPLDAIRAGAVQHILSRQREDGSWAQFHDGPADLSTTIEAYAALKVLGVNGAGDAMTRALRTVHNLGGVARARVFTKIWLALFGQYPWAGVPSMPPELVHFPLWAPFNLYDFACWARGTIAPLLIVISRRPVRPLGTELGELVLPGTEHLLARVPGSGLFWWLDRLQKLYERLPRQPGRARARRKLVSWVVRRQEADGGWGGIQPPWVYSLMALHLEGYPPDHPVMRRGIEGLDGFTIVEGGLRRLEACQSPVWDTALALVALRDCGLAPEHPALVRAAGWLFEQEIRVRGDWAVRRPELEPSGFAFEFANRNYPDVDDTAEVVMALRAAAHPDRERQRAVIERAARWTLGMQCRDGGFAAFDADNTRALCGELPFCDFGEVIDPPTADVTAHVIEMLAAEPAAQSFALARGREWLRAEQERDGSWFGRWGVNFVYGTGAAVPALIVAGTPREDARVGAAVRWLAGCQNEEGGFGEDLRSYEDAS